MQIVDEILTKAIETKQTPSVHYLFFDSRNVIHQFHAGYADIQRRRKTDERTTYHAFSATKTFTALSVLQLMERNMLDIHQPAKHYLPEFPYPGDITIKQLLAHSAGLPNPIPLNWIHLAEQHTSFNRNEFVAEVLRRHNKVTSPPNEKYKYSNIGYLLLGQLIEKVSGMIYENYVTDHVLKPLNFQSEEIGFTVPEPARHAKGYLKRFSLMNFILGFVFDKTAYMDLREDGWIPFKLNYVNGAPYGGLIGTPRSFMVYIQELLKPDNRLIAEKYRRMLFTENRTNDEQPTGMCLSWFCGRLNGMNYYLHAGGGGGYYCEIRIYPDAGLGSVLMSNRTAVSDERYLNKLDLYFL